MDKQTITTLLDLIGCKKIKCSAGEISSSCPYPQNHKHNDRNPSFSVKINSGGFSPYICHACHAKGSIEFLAKDFGMEHLVPELGKVQYPKKKLWMSTSVNAFCNADESPVFFEDQYLDFDFENNEYFKSRGISDLIRYEWELGFDHRFNRAIFVLRDYNGRLAMVIGRDTTGKSKAKYSNYVFDSSNKAFLPYIDRDREKDFISPTRRFFLYGEHHASLVSEKKITVRFPGVMVLVEGPVDVLKFNQFGFLSVGALGSYVNDNQIDKLIHLVPRGWDLILLPDNDEAGELMRKEVCDSIRTRIKVFTSDVPEGKDPGSMTFIEAFDCVGRKKLMR